MAMLPEGVAKEILRQLGGNRFLCMTGAKVINFADNAIMFSLPRNMSYANRFTVELTPDDTYTVKFIASTRNEPLIYESSGIYFDMLQETFTRITGMYTHL